MSSNTDANFKTDYERLNSVKIKAAYLADIKIPFAPWTKTKIHSAYLFVTEDNRVLTFTALPENELKPGGMIKYKAAQTGRQTLNLFNKAQFATTFDFGALKAAIYETREFTTPGSDLDHATRDQANYDEVIQGQGIAGLKPKSNVSLVKISKDEKDAQDWFAKALAANKILDQARFKYEDEGPNVFNSHTVSAMPAAMRGAEAMNKYKAALGQYAPGAPHSLSSPGPDLATIMEWAKPENDGKPEARRYIKGKGLPFPDSWLVHYAP